MTAAADMGAFPAPDGVLGELFEAHKSFLIANEYEPVDQALSERHTRLIGTILLERVANHEERQRLVAEFNALRDRFAAHLGATFDVKQGWTGFK